MAEIDKRLAAAIEGRRQELGLSPSAFAKATGVTAQGLSAIRRGEQKNYREDFRRSICRVFGWTPDSIDRLLTDRDPILSEVGPDLIPSADQRINQVEQDIREMREQIASLTRGFHRLGADAD